MRALTILLIGASAVMAAPTPPPGATLGDAINTFKDSPQGAEVAKFLNSPGQPAEQPAENPTGAGQPEQWPENNMEQPAVPPAENPMEAGQPEQWPENNKEQPAVPPADPATVQPEQWPENNMEQPAVPPADPATVQPEQWPENNMEQPAVPPADPATVQPEQWPENNMEQPAVPPADPATVQPEQWPENNMEQPAVPPADPATVPPADPATGQPEQWPENNMDTNGMPSTGVDPNMVNPEGDNMVPKVVDPVTSSEPMPGGTDNSTTTDAGMPGVMDPMDNSTSTDAGMPATTTPETVDPADANMPSTEETWSANNSTGSSNSTETGMKSGTAKVEDEICKVSLGANGYSPKEMSVKQGSTLSFSVEGNGTYTITQSAKDGSCTPMNGGFGSKNLTKGDTWNYTVPARADGSLHFFSGTGKECEANKMWATATVVDNLVGDNTTTAGSSNRTRLEMSGAGSMAPVATSITAVVLAAAHWLL